jgi:hypothetical protein
MHLGVQFGSTTGGPVSAPITGSEGGGTGGAETAKFTDATIDQGRASTYYKMKIPHGRPGLAWRRNFRRVAKFALFRYRSPVLLLTKRIGAQAAAAILGFSGGLPLTSLSNERTLSELGPRKNSGDMGGAWQARELPRRTHPG